MVVGQSTSAPWVNLAAVRTLCRQNAPSIAILQLWPSYKELSRLAYQGELLRTIKGAKKAGRDWGKISLDEFEQLSVDEKYLVITDQTLFNYFLAGRGCPRPVPEGRCYECGAEPSARGSC